MLKVGDKIKQVKEIYGFGKTGNEYSVTFIDKDGNITFESNVGRGVMNYSEFKKFFEAVPVCNKNKSAKNKYGEYKTCKIYDPMTKEVMNCEVASNGKSIKARVYIPNEFKVWSNDPMFRVGVASCSPRDKFDMSIGTDIAYARAMVKIWEAIVQNYVGK